MSASGKKKRTSAHRFEKSLIITLLALNIFFLLAPKRLGRRPLRLVKTLSDIVVQDIRVFQPPQPSGPPAAALSSEPIPEPVISETAETIEPLPEPGYESSSEPGLGVGDGGSGIFAPARVDTIRPRPLLQVIPEYPREERKRKTQGVVRLRVHVDRFGKVDGVVVNENTTGSALCEKAAVEAAYRSRYQPARAGSKTVKMWTTCEYGFKPE